MYIQKSQIIPPRLVALHLPNKSPHRPFPNNFPIHRPRLYSSHLISSRSPKPTYSLSHTSNNQISDAHHYLTIHSGILPFPSFPKIGTSAFSPLDSSMEEAEA